MRKRLFLIVLLTFMFPVVAVAQQGENLLTPDGWSPRQDWQKQGDFWQTLDEDGQTVIRLVKKPTVLTQGLDTDGSLAKVKLSADVRLSDIEPDGRWGVPMLSVRFKDRDGQLIKDSEEVKFLRDGGDWKAESVTADVPEDAYRIEAWLVQRANSGQADFRNVTLETLEIREAPERASQAGTAGGPVTTGGFAYDEHATWHLEPAQKPIAQWQADVDVSQVQRVIHVAAGGDGDGSEASPMGSVKAAVAAAGESIKAGVPTKVQIGPGVYRESWFEVNAKQLGGEAKDTLLVIEGAGPGQTFIRGSESQGFEPSTWELVDEQRNIYRLPWTTTELEPVPVDAWSPATAPVSRHRVMVFVNGGWLKPVQLETYRHEKKEEKYEREHGGISTRRWVEDIYTGIAGLEAMEPGTIAVNTLGPGEAGFDEQPHDHPNSLLIRLPEGLDFDEAEVEVAWGGSGGFRFNEKNNVALRGMTIEHMGIAAVWAKDSDHVLVEDVDVLNNDGGDGATAVRFLVCEHVTLRNAKINHNGPFGLHLKTKFATIDNVQVNENNWRGGLSGHAMHGNGGASLYISHTLFRDSQFNRNHGFGFRQDGLGEHVVIENCQFNENTKNGGMMWEISYGPVVIRDCEVIANNGRGVHILNQHGLTLERTIIANNADKQLSIYPMINRGKKIDQGVPRFSGPTRWPMGEEPHEGYWIEGIVAMKLNECTIAVTDPSLADSPLIEGQYWTNTDHYYQDWLTHQLQANSNHYWHVAQEHVFDIGKATGDSGNFAALSQWREVTGEDGYSRWAPITDRSFPAPAKPEVETPDLPVHRQ